MSTRTIAFFNNVGGVGKTTLVYHLAWKYADQGTRVIVVDLDPQANLTSSFLDESRLEPLWNGDDDFRTIHQCLRPIIRGIGDIDEPTLECFGPRLALLAGDIGLSEFEDDLSSVWPECQDGKERAFRVTSAFWRVIQRACEIHEADLALIDLGPNLGAINRAALIASDHVVVPLAADLYSLQGMANLGPKLRAWRDGWAERLKRNPARGLDLPPGRMNPLGYVVMQHSIRLDRPVQSYERWIRRIPPTFHADVMGNTEPVTHEVLDDPKCLALLKHYRSLMAMAHEARKPVFHLRSADGAIGSHFTAARNCGKDFEVLAGRILQEAERAD